MPIYTAISFAPVQGFIEKSRKLRDLFGASLMLSYLSYKLVEKAKNNQLDVISPGMPNVQKGMPNRILIQGEFPRDDVAKTLLEAWKNLLQECRQWVEETIPVLEKYRENKETKYYWEEEWRRWGMYCWEIFWGHGDSPLTAMKDLETRKLRRDWIGINWMGESSSLTGTDAIAWPKLGMEDNKPGRQLTPVEKDELEDFYSRLSYALERPLGEELLKNFEYRPVLSVPEDSEIEGKFLATNEKLSIPELVKRLITYENIANRIGIDKLEEGFTDIVRKPSDEKKDKKNNDDKSEVQGQWTGWFMGDGDKVGEHLQKLVQSENDANTQIKKFSEAMREWGEKFDKTFPKDLGRVIYAGGDDFLGAIYSKDIKKPIQPSDALKWLMALPEEWEKHKQSITVSVGFIWAGSSVPQRDILQHCRDAEKVAKKRGRDRVTIRVVFNSGQYVQWTCPWNYLYILQEYQDRDGKKFGDNPNWAHIYSDWAYLQGRHSIPKANARKHHENYKDGRLGLNLFDIYFPRDDKNQQKYSCFLSEKAQEIVGSTSDEEIINWIDGLIKVAWQLYSNIEQ